MLQQWWLDRMATSATPLQEKLTLFFHGHFATANYKVNDMLLMYRQNALFRANATGNFRDLVHQMSLQPAMLIWLDNDPNVKGSPNENFARELMELFTLGVDKYSQADVVASARAWTGHNTLDGDRETYNFYPDTARRRDEDVHGRHAELGRPRHHRLHPRDRRDAQAHRRGVHRRQDVVVLRVPEARARGRRRASPTAFMANDLSIHDLVRAIFMHPNFVSPKAMNGLVRTPAEWVAACMRVVNITAENANPQWYMEDMGQQLFEPPNVSGWRPNEYWLTTSRAVGARELGPQSHLARRREPGARTTSSR